MPWQTAMAEDATVDQLRHDRQIIGQSRRWHPDAPMAG